MWVWCLIGIYLPPTPFVWMVEHSPESNAGPAGICVQISRDSPISLTQEPGRAAQPTGWNEIIASQDTYFEKKKKERI